MVNTLMRPLRRWPAVEAFLMRLVGRFTTWPVDDFDRFVRAPVGLGMAAAEPALPPFGQPFRPPAPMSIAPATFEMRFMKLHAEGRFDEMWEMIAEDAQRAWGGREMFIRDMPRLGDDTEILDVQVVNVRNDGAIPNLAENAVVEVACRIDASGATPLPVEPLAPEMLGLVEQVKAYERLTVAAAVSGDRDLALKALMANPLTSQYRVAKPLLDALLEANREHLPRFF